MKKAPVYFFTPFLFVSAISVWTENHFVSSKMSLASSSTNRTYLPRLPYGWREYCMVTKKKNSILSFRRKSLIANSNIIQSLIPSQNQSLPRTVIHTHIYLCTLRSIDVGTIHTSTCEDVLSFYSVPLCAEETSSLLLVHQGQMRTETTKNATKQLLSEESAAVIWLINDWLITTWNRAHSSSTYYLTKTGDVR